MSWPWLFLLRGWDSPTIAFTGKFVHMAHSFILLGLNPFDLSVTLVLIGLDGDLSTPVS